ncbi:hypothetical protein L9F63_022845 [Diploptera punctata]|uniref:Mitochondrial basic amino acids transporter n=1 Tax=Diploptera punctata TaxID=6984 RepID=A0AAD7ZLC0_DIPPU|nr:hypothetical protein L9F63_022845 [Diploptera punctata]
MALDFVAGCLGGCAGVLVGHPFDTVKVRLQTQDFRNPQYRGAVDCFSKIIKRESVSGLYKGMSSPMAGVAFVNAIVFGVHGNFQRNFTNPDAASSHFTAGAAAGFVQSFVCSPMELVKTRLQVQKKNTYSGPLNCLVQVFKSEGIRGVFRGLGTTICREIPGFGTYFYSYELMTRSSGDGLPISTLNMLLAGGLSGTLSWVLTYPIDVVKTRLQADGCNGECKYTGFMDCLKKSVQSEGYGVLSRGLNSTILRAFPTNAATFTVVTWVVRWANAHHIDENQGYVIPDVVNFQNQVYVPILEKPAHDSGFGSKTFGLRERTELRDSYLSNILNWRKIILHDIVSNNSLSNPHCFSKSGQVYSLENTREDNPKNENLVKDIQVSLELRCSKCLDSEIEVNEDENISEEEILQNDCAKYEKETSTYEHDNDYYISSVRKMEVDPDSCASQKLISQHGGRCMSTQAMQSLYELRQNGLLCDATVRVDDGGVFPVHRAILSACSSYFRALFTTTLHSREKIDVLLPGVTSDKLTLILQYAYLRQVDISEENVCELLITADYLCVVGVLELCCEFLRNSLTVHNCIGIMRFAREYFCFGLEADARRFVMRNFVQVSQQSDELLELPVQELRSMVGADELNVKSEELVWDCVLRWINHDADNRKAHIVDLMKNIRLGLIDTQFFLENVKDHPYVTGNDACRPIIIETLKFLYDLEMITQKDGEVPTPEIARPRVPHEILFAIGGWSGGSPTNFIETYDTRADRWVKVEEVDRSGPRAYHGTAVVGFNIYVIGGFDGMDYFNSCRCFNAVNKTWREVAPMNARRCYVSVAVLGELVYAMGGYDGHHRQNTAERYNYRTNQWSLIAPMNVQRSDASATTLNDRIYITGGFNGQECMNSAEVYDPETNQWTMIQAMRSRRSGVSCIAYHRYVYVIGGFNGISRMCSGEKYNPATNTWTQIPDMYNPRSNFAIEVIDDMVFAIGGFNGVTTIYHVECYDEKTNEWYEATDMNIYRSALSACVIMGLPNVYDYIHKHRERLMEEKRQKLLALENQRNQQASEPQIQQPQQQANNNQQNNLNVNVNIQQNNNNNNDDDENMQIP